MNQPDLFTARQLGRAGQKKVLDKELEAWKALATEAALKIAREKGELTIEDVYEKVGPPPRHVNSAGALIATMIAKGAPIEWTGRITPSTRPSRRYSFIRVWAYAPKGSL